MTNGLYRVTTPYLCAGFVVSNGVVTRCAPILRKRLAYWRTVAVLVPSTAPFAAPEPFAASNAAARPSP